MAWSRSRRSPYQGGMIVSAVMSASWVSPILPPGSGSGGLDGTGVPSGRQNAKPPPPGAGGDQVAAVVDRLVVPGAQADQVGQVGAAAAGPELDVVQVDPAGLTAREPAPAAVPLAGGAADRGAGPAAAPAQGQHGAAVAVGHPGQRGAAAEHLRGGDADRRAVLDVAPGRIRRITGNPRGRGRFRGNARRGRRRAAGQDIRAGVHHDLVHLRVIGPGHLAGQERLRDRDQAISQVRGGPDSRGVRGGRRRPQRAFPRPAGPRRRAFPRKRRRPGHPPGPRGQRRRRAAP